MNYIRIRSQSLRAGLPLLVKRYQATLTHDPNFYFCGFDLNNSSCLLIYPFCLFFFGFPVPRECVCGK
jgi:hypothetical protein